jgi:hypothetical protein
VGAASAAAAMAAGLWAVEAAAPAALVDPVGRLGVLLALLAAGTATYVLAAMALRSPELIQLRGAMSRLGRRST